MSEDGAGRKVVRLNEIARKIHSFGAQGVTQVRICNWAERHLGLSEERANTYIAILEREREIFFDPSRRRYTSVEVTVKLSPKKTDKTE